MKKDIKAEKAKNDFVDKKIRWLAKLEEGNLVSNLKVARNEKLIKSLPNSRLNLFNGLLRSYARNVEKISEYALDKIQNFSKAQELLFTISVIENGREKYIGEIPEFVELFKKMILEAKM
jgi:hypothetical protein